MITLALINFAVVLVENFGELFTVPAPPGWATNPSAVGVVFQAIGSMGVWFPTATVIVIVGTAFAVRLIGMGIKVARMAISLMTGGGGHAGG
jgi:hypothetical protein